MSRRKPAILAALLLVVPLLVTPAAAFYFDFQGFVTDKLVYEVGETISMSADLIADFGAGGWCYVSFSVAGNEGPLHFEEYYISPSPSVRTFNSSNTILPADISPGVSGTQAFAQFFAEIFDTVSQSDGHTIELTIIRGHLSVIPMTELIIPAGSNATIIAKIASSHNNDIVNAGANVIVQITDTNSSTILNTTTTTDGEGLLYVDWIDTMGPIGTYNLSILGAGTDDFLPFFDTFALEVIPPESSLTIVDVPVQVYCQSPDATQWDIADIRVLHEDILGDEILGSTLSWTTSFGSGGFLEEGMGYYAASIPIHSDPGQQMINISASNPSYQTGIQSISLQVIPNPVQVIMQSESWNVTQGNSLTVNFTATEFVDWNQPIAIEFQDSLGEFSFQSACTPDIVTSIIFLAEENITPGRHTVSAIITDNHYNLSEMCTFDIIIIGTLEIDLLDISAIYGNSLSFSVAALDIMNSTVDLISYSIYCDGNPTPIASVGFTNSTIPQQVDLPLSIDPGNHTFTFRFSSTYYELTQLVMNITVWMETNISIIIVEANVRNDTLGGIASYGSTNLIWSNHESTTNFVDWEYICMSSCRPADFSDQLPEI